MTPEPGVYIMTKEQKATIPVNINSVADDLMSYVRFHLNLTVRREFLIHFNCNGH